MYTLFISDLHLDVKTPEMTQSFLHYLEREETRGAQALYILGDLFEVWIGDDHDTPFNEQIASALKALAKTGVKIYFMRGNRDFILGKRFCKKAGMQFLKDPTVIELYQHKILLTHGDVLCTSDIKHQKFRRYTQNPIFYALSCIIPLAWRQKFADTVRKSSRQHNQEAPKEILDVTQKAVEDFLLRYQVKKMIHGHTHRPAIHSLEEGRERIVLSDWHLGAHQLRINDTGEKILEKIRNCTNDASL